MHSTLVGYGFYSWIVFRWKYADTSKLILEQIARTDNLTCIQNQKWANKIENNYSKNNRLKSNKVENVNFRVIIIQGEVKKGD